MPKSRQLAARAFWIAAGTVLGFGTALLIVSLARLDPDDPDSGIAAGFISLVIGSGTIAGALILAGFGLLLSADRTVGLPGYFAALGTACFAGGMTLFRATDWNVVLLLIAAGSFYVVWRQVAVPWQQQTALAGILLATVATIFFVVPLIVGIIVLGAGAILVLNLRRLNERLRRPPR